jgi:hypothetical protein
MQATFYAGLTRSAQEERQWICSKPRRTFRIIGFFNSAIWTKNTRNIFMNHGVHIGKYPVQEKVTRVFRIFGHGQTAWL